jgi:predicted DNA-binding protein YlxM (UPF0122 family)
MLDIKDEILRLLDERWRFHRFYYLRQRGMSFAEIAEIFECHPSTVRNYSKRGEREAEHFGTLYYHLSTRTRKLLLDRSIDTTRREAEIEAAWIVNHPEACPRSYHGGQKPIGKGLGRVTRDEILNAIDLLRRACQ